MTAPRRNYALLAACLLLPAGITACPGGSTGDARFDDHTKPSLPSVDAFEQYAEVRASNTAVKFVITRFLAAGEQIRWLKSDEYTLHDQWYWFRLVNDVAVDGVDAHPVDVGQKFAHVVDIDAWARKELAAGHALPLDLTFVENNTRLYSPHFYDLALFNPKKTLGIGTVLHFQKCDDFDETWAIELEYQHVLSREELVDIFAIVEKTLPASIGDSLKILVRQPQHEELLRELRAAHDPLADRFIHYTDVTPKTKTVVASPGLVAGRFRVVHHGEPIANVRATDVVVAEDAADALPAAAALLSASPVSRVVAEQGIVRGTPAIVRADILADPNIDGMSRVLAPVIVKASSTSFSMVAMTEGDFATYRTLSQTAPTSVPPVDTTTLSYAYDVATVAANGTLAQWTPALGVDGAHLGVASSVVDVAPSVAISVRAYLEHIASFQDQIDAIVVDSDFVGSELVRSLALEGRDGFLRRHPDQTSFPDHELDPRPASDPLKSAVAHGGITGMIREKSIDVDALNAIQNAIGFAPIALRASTNVPGHPIEFETVATTSTDLESAIKDVWASYWSSDAFEERRLANIAATSGAMAVVASRAVDANVVHASVALAHDGLKVELDALVDGRRHAIIDALSGKIAHALVAQRNVGLSEPQRRSTIAVSIELEDDVVAAVRPIEPPASTAPGFIRQMPMPGDIVDRAYAVDQRTCDAGKVRATFTEAVDDPLRGADTGFRSEPFTAFVVLDFADDVPELGATAGQKRSVIHTQYAFAHASLNPWQIDVTVDDASVAGAGVAHVSFDGATLTVTRDQTFSAAATCVDNVLFRSPEAFLQSVLDKSDGIGG